MVIDLHEWLYSFMGIDTGFYFGPHLTVIIPALFWAGLFMNEVPIDLKIFDTTYSQLRNWLEGSVPDNQKDEFRLFSAFAPFIYTYLAWVLSEVIPATLVDQNLFNSHRLGTTASLILSFIYTVTPSIIFAGNYLFV